MWLCVLKIINKAMAHSFVSVAVTRLKGLHNVFDQFVDVVTHVIWNDIAFQVHALN
jgi:hypothetical protein